MIRQRSLMASALILLAAVGCAEAERDASGDIQTAGAVDAFSIQVGDCFDDQTATEEVSDVPGVPCTTPHDNEVFATFDLTAPKWPGDEQVNGLADEGCLERFQKAIGTTYEESVLMITTLVPSQGSWTQMDDREVVCVTYHMEYEKLEGSVLGSGM